MIAPPRKPRLRYDLLLALLVGAGAGVVAYLGSAPGVLFGDGGELQFAAWTAGLPHPTGYPLYMIAGWAWSHLLDAAGLAPPARAMTLLSVLYGALAVGLTFLLARTLIDLALPRLAVALQRLAAMLAAVTFAFTPTFWSQAVVTEVYTLNALFVALVLWLAMLWQRRVGSEERMDPVMAGLALAFGLSLAHHRTTLLLAPVVLVFLAWQAPAGYWRRNRRAIPWLAVLVLAPLLLYLYVPLRANATPYLTMELQPGHFVSLLDRSPAGLASYLLGSGFSGELVSFGTALAQAPALLKRFTAELTWPGVVLAGAGIAVLAVRRHWGLLWLTGGSFLALTAFNLFYTIGDIAVFYIPSHLIACTWIGVAAAWLASLPWRRPSASSPQGEASPLGQPGRQRKSRGRLSPSFVVPFAVISVLFALSIHLFTTHVAGMNRSQDTRAQDWWDSLLAANPPQGAVLVTNDRDEMMPLWYLQLVEGRRRDLAGVFPLLMPGEHWADIGRVVDSAQATGRPVSLIKPMPGLEVKAQLGQPNAAGLTPVLGPAANVPPGVELDVRIGDTIRLAGVTVEPATVQPGQVTSIDLYWQPIAATAADYTSFVQLLLPDGTKVAQSDKPAGGVFYPTSLWQPGETLLDRHALALPADAPPGPYRLLVGMYELVDGSARPIGSTMIAN